MPGATPVPGAPFLHPLFVRVVLDAIEGVEAAVPVEGGRPHPLAAAEPGLRSLVNLNEPGEYERARAAPTGPQSSGE